MNTENIEKVGKCSQCNRDAGWNTPCLDEQDNLWCDGCADKSRDNIMFRGINQFVKDGKFQFTGGVTFNGVVVWKDYSCWTEGGSRACHLTAEEKTKPVDEVARLINQEYNVEKITRCTGCDKKMTKDEIAGYPLFAGVCCSSCMEDHKRHLEEQVNKGHVCGMCRRPYGDCCC